MTKRRPGPLGQVLPAVAAAEGRHQQQACEPGLLHDVDDVAIALIIHRLWLTEAAEGGDDPGPWARLRASLLHGSRIQGIPLNDLDSLRAQLGGHLRLANQGQDPVTLAQGVNGEGAAQPAAGSEDKCAWHVLLPVAKGLA